MHKTDPAFEIRARVALAMADFIVALQREHRAATDPRVKAGLFAHLTKARAKQADIDPTDRSRISRDR